MSQTSASVTDDVIGLLDIGSSKIACAIVRVQRSARGATALGAVLGIGHHRTSGLTSGVVVNLDLAEQSIRAAVSQAERMASVKIDRVVATVVCGRIKSHRFRAHCDLEDQPVNRDHLARLQSAAEAYARRGGRLMIHCNRTGFELDDAGGISNPLGLGGDRLTSLYHAISGDEAPIYNLIQVIERCYLSVDALVPAPVASALAVTTPDERMLGVTVVDMGGGTISFAEFRNGRLCGCGVLPVGGQHVTYDVARRFGAPIREAERIKALYGTMVVGPSDRDQMVALSTTTNPDFAGGFTRGELQSVIAQRLRRQIAALGEVLERECGALNDADLGARPNEPFSPTRIILTGGASQIAALPIAVANALGRPTSFARPHQLPGVSADLTAPQLAAMVGLTQCLPSLGQRMAGDIGQSPRSRVGGSGYMRRVQDWVRSAF